MEVAVWLDTLEKLSAAAKKAEEDYASASFVLQQAHEELDKLYTLSEQYSQQLRDKDGALETVRLKVNMLEATHQQLDGQIAVLRSNVENNAGNIARIEEEMKGTDDRSGGIVLQIDQTKLRIEQIQAALSGKQEELNNLQQELAAMTANAQGLTKQYLELRTTQSNLTAELAGSEADIRGLKDSMEQSMVRMLQLQDDLNAGKLRHQQADENLRLCRKELRRAQDPS